MKKWTLRLFWVLALFVGLGAVAFLIYAQFQYAPNGILKEQVNIDEIETGEEGLLFRPETANGKGVVFYQGAKVQEEAYAYLAKKLSEQGFLIIIPQMPLNFGIFGRDKADLAIERHPEVSNGLSAAIL